LCNFYFSTIGEEENDPFLKMAEKEHKLKMKILRMKYWKLKQECIAKGMPAEFEESNSDEEAVGETSDLSYISLLQDTSFWISVYLPILC